MLYILGIVIFFLIFLILLILLIPLKIVYDINVNVNKEKEKKIDEKLKLNNTVIVYLIGVIPIKKIDLNKKENAGNNKLEAFIKLLKDYQNYEKKEEKLLPKKDLSKLRNSIYYQEMHLEIGVNVQDYLINAYINAFLNMVINLYISFQMNHFNIKKTEYITYISDCFIDLKAKGIIHIKVVNTMIILIKLILKLRKVANKNGRRTSNRKFNDDSYDFA